MSRTKILADLFLKRSMKLPLGPDPLGLGFKQDRFMPSEFGQELEISDVDELKATPEISAEIKHPSIDRNASTEEVLAALSKLDLVLESFIKSGPVKSDFMFRMTKTYQLLQEMKQVRLATQNYIEKIKSSNFDTKDLIECINFFESSLEIVTEQPPVGVVENLSTASFWTELIRTPNYRLYISSLQNAIESLIEFKFKSRKKEARLNYLKAL